MGRPSNFVVHVHRGCLAFVKLTLATLASAAPGLFAGERDIIISEIHYHPLGLRDPGLEFVELYNGGRAPVDLNGWALVSGVEFTFPGGVFLGPNAYLVVAADPSALRAQHVGIEIVGPYTGRLDNSGETIELLNRSGQSITRVHYRDGDGWPSRPDGRGPSLECIVGAGDIDRSQVWAPSLHFGGTPGAPNTHGPEEYPYRGDSLAAAVRINEVNPRTAGGERGFVELHNSSTDVVDVARFSILVSSGERATLPAGASVGPGERVTFSADVLGFAPGAAAATYVLVHADGLTFVDALETPVLAAGFSAGRAPDGRGDAHVIVPSPGGPNQFERDRRVVINEIFFAPRFEAPSAGCFEDCADRHQWLELRNRTGLAIDLTGWTLDRGVKFAMPPSTTLGPGGFLVVVASQAAFARAHPGVATVAGEWTGSLGSREEKLVLRDAIGNVADSVHYGNGNPFNDEDENGQDDRTLTSSDWPAGVSDSNRSIELLNEFLESSAGRSWRLGPAGGTPGARNSVFEDNPLPVLAGVTHAPPVPDSRTPVRVSCEAYAVDGIRSVEVVWRLDGQGNSNTVVLRDDGSLDVTALDGVYAAEIPAQPHRSIVAFQIVVTSVSGRSETYPPRPAVGTRTPFYLYEVDDDDPLANGSPDYRVIMSRADVDLLHSRPVQSDTLLNCTFIGNGEVRHMAGIRYRGENSRNLERKSYRIEFSPEKRFEGIEQMNLNASNGGSPPTSSIRDYLSADLFRRAGLPYPWEWPVNLHFARGVSGNLEGRTNVDPFYVCKENFDRHFLSRYFGAASNGNLYRPRDPGGGSGDLSYRGEDESAYARFYEKKSNRDLNDYSDLIELVRGFDSSETPDAVFEAEMRRLLDVNEWASFFAIQDYLTNIDGGIQTNNGEDYFLYHVADDAPRADAGKWLILPWDIEETFDNANTGLFITSVAAPRRFLRHQAFAPLYLKALVELVDGPAAPGEMRPTYQYVRDVFPSSSVNGILSSFDNYTTRRADLIKAQVPRTFEVAVSQGGPTGTRLIALGESWSYFKGTAEPSDGALDWAFPGFNDSSWPRGPSGLGYGDNDDATVLDDMQSGGGNEGYLSVYVRKTFEVADLNAIGSLALVVDYDDAFVAYLNGAEIARSPNLGAVGQTNELVPFDTEMGDAISHEASAGNNNPNPPETFAITAWRDLVKKGTNVLAIQGLNARRNSGDFSLLPELVAQGAVVAGGGGWGSELFVSGGVAMLRGVAPGHAAAVRVGGNLATIESRPPAGGQPYSLPWQANVAVGLGANRVRVEAFADPGGKGDALAIREVTVHRIDKAFVAVNGALAGSPTWTSTDGPYLISSGVRVPANATLTILEGTRILIAGGSAITVDGVLNAVGTEAKPIVFQPYALSSRWAGIQLGATGTTASAPVHRLSHAVVELAGVPAGQAGALTVRGSKVVVEGCVFRGLGQTGIDARDAVVEVAGSRFEGRRGGIVAQSSDIVVTASSFKGMTGDADAINLRGNLSAPCRIERCGIEAGEGDGVELVGTTAELRFNTIRRLNGTACLVNGASTLGPSTISGNVFFDSRAGLELRGAGEAALPSHLTVLWCDVGLLAGREANAPDASTVAHSLILWGNRQAIDVGDRFQLALSWSNVADSLWPGPGNISQDPLLSAPFTGDFSLASSSPCRGTGQNGADMGATGGATRTRLFLRGDVDEDGTLNLTDGIAILSHLFRGGGPLRCDDAADADDNGTVNVTDVIKLLNYLFRGGDPPALPYPKGGEDPTTDGLECK